MRLEHYTNNGYDSVILRNDTSEITGAWPNNSQAIVEFYADGCNPSEWEANGDEWQPDAGMDTLISAIGADGKLIATDESLMASRCEFWGISPIKPFAGAIMDKTFSLLDGKSREPVFGLKDVEETNAILMMLVPIDGQKLAGELGVHESTIVRDKHRETYYITRTA